MTTYCHKQIEHLQFRIMISQSTILQRNVVDWLQIVKVKLDGFLELLNRRV